MSEQRTEKKTHPLFQSMFLRARFERSVVTWFRSVLYPKRTAICAFPALCCCTCVSRRCTFASESRATKISPLSQVVRFCALADPWTSDRHSCWKPSLVLSQSPLGSALQLSGCHSTCAAPQFGSACSKLFLQQVFRTPHAAVGESQICQLCVLTGRWQLVLP